MLLAGAFLVAVVVIVILTIRLRQVRRSPSEGLDVFEASSAGDIPRLTKLLRHDPTLANATRDHYDRTPLHCCREQLAAARFLLANGANPNFGLNDDAWLPLHGRAEHGDVEMVRLLLESGAKPNAVSDMGTPLHLSLIHI